MVLDSQSGRPEIRHRLRMSQRSQSLAPWVVLAVVVAGAGAWYYWGRDMTAMPLEADAPPALTQDIAVSPEPDPKPVAVTPPTEPPPPAIPPIPQVQAPTTQEKPSVDDLLKSIQDTQKRVEARHRLSELLLDRAEELTEADQQLTRQALTNINLDLVYSRTILPGDPLAEAYTIASGDNLTRIARRYKVTPQFLAWINGLRSANHIMAGQKLKVIRGPFHAVIHKADYRMDLFLVDPDGKWIYVNSLPVGVGTNDSTPVGKWIVEPGSKVENPQWTHPHTHKYYAPDNPENPIGEYWIGLEGIDQKTALRKGYGIHGTIEPDSIGAQMSLGCVRLREKDIELVYKLLVEGESTVEIRP